MCVWPSQKSPTKLCSSDLTVWKKWWEMDSNFFTAFFAQWTLCLWVRKSFCVCLRVQQGLQGQICIVKQFLLRTRAIYFSMLGSWKLWCPWEGPAQLAMENSVNVKVMCKVWLLFLPLPESGCELESVSLSC